MDVSLFSNAPWTGSVSEKKISLHNLDSHCFDLCSGIWMVLKSVLSSQKSVPEKLRYFGPSINTEFNSSFDVDIKPISVQPSVFLFFVASEAHNRFYLPNQTTNGNPGLFSPVLALSPKHVTSNTNPSNLLGFNNTHSARLRNANPTLLLLMMLKL